MTPHQVLDDEALDRAALFAIDALEPDEADAFRGHLAGCSPCRAEVDALRDASAELLLAAPPVPPAASLAGRVRDAVAVIGRAAAPSRRAAKGSAEVQTWKRWADDGALPFRLVRAGDSGFEPTATPGVSVRRLSVDTQRGEATMLVRMAPGSAYPSHRHGGDEECFVLEGDLQIGDETTMAAGDYQRARGESVHPLQWTRGGCLLLIRSSLNDELLPA